MSKPVTGDYVLTERDILRDYITWTACTQGKNIEEKDSSISVIPGGPKSTPMDHSRALSKTVCLIA